MRARLLGLSGLVLVGPPAARASAWPQPGGTARVALTYTGLSSKTQFAPGDALGLTGPRCPIPRQAGDRMPYSCVTGGVFTAHQVTADAAVGLTDALSIDAAIPVVLHSAFTDDIGRSVARGLGDVRFGARVGGEHDGWAGTVAILLQAPTGPRNFQDREVPIGQGQWDVTVTLRGGRSLWPRGWVETHQGVRIRLSNEQTGIDPGDEWVGVASGGWTPVDAAGVLGQVEWILAANDDTGFGLTAPGRRLLQTRLGVFVRPIEPLWLDVTVGIPLVGRSWPAAPTAAVSAAWIIGA